MRGQVEEGFVEEGFAGEIRLGWNSDLELWEGDVGPTLGSDDPAIGPAGPGGVCVLGAADASVSLCLTGRVVSLWAAARPDHDSRLLLAQFVDASSMERLLSADPGEPELRMQVIPVGERLRVTQAAILGDCLLHGDLDRQHPARFLALAEYAAALQAHPPRSLVTVAGGEALGDGINSLMWDPSGERLVLGAGRKVLVLEVEAAGRPGPLGTHDGVVTSVAWDHDGRRVVSGGWDGAVRVWDVERPCPDPEDRPEPLGTHDGVVTSVAWDPDGRRVVSGGEDGAVRVWDVERPCPDPADRPEPLGTHDGVVRSVAWDPDGRRVVSGGEDKAVRVWDVAHPCAKRADRPEPLGTHDGVVTSVAWDHDGRRVVSGGEDKAVRVWDANSPCPDPAGRPEPLGTHDASVTSVAWHPDRHRVVSGGDDKAVRVWDANSPCPDPADRPEPLGTHDAPVTSVAWHPDGHRVVSGGRDGAVWVWGPPPWSEILDRCDEEEVAFGDLAWAAASTGADPGALKARLTDMISSIEQRVGRAAARNRPSLEVLKDFEHALAEMARGAAAGAALLERRREVDIEAPLWAPEVRAGGGGARPSLDAPKANRLEPPPDVTVRAVGRWRLVSAPTASDGLSSPYRWAKAFDSSGRLVGASRFAGPGASATATVAVSAEVARWEISAHPLGTPPVGIASMSIEAATRLSRAAWFAWRAGRPVAGEMFAGAVMAWLGVGVVHRAGWAWALADQGAVRDMLERRHATDLREALIAAASSGYLPTASVCTAVPVPLWAYVADLEALGRDDKVDA